MIVKCDKCKEVYEDYSPVDDCCIKCKEGEIRYVYDSCPECGGSADYLVLEGNYIVCANPGTCTWSKELDT